MTPVSALAPAVRSGLFGLLALGTAGCGASEGPAWLRLAEGFTPAPVTGEFAVGDYVVVPGGPDDPPHSAWVGKDVTWTDSGFPDLWHADRPVGNLSSLQDSSAPASLWAGDVEFPEEPFAYDLPEKVAEIAPGSHARIRDKIFLKAFPGETPPTARFLARVDRGEPDGGLWKVPIGRFTAEGIPVWPGGAEVLTVDVPAGSALLVQTATCALATPIVDQDHSPGEVVFRVLLDGEAVLEERRAVSGRGDRVEHRVALPPEARGGAELRFEVEGVAAHTAFLTPTLAPADLGDYAGRPWGDDRPDIVLFLADTFRADNLAAYGNELGLTPAIDALAAESRVFAAARAPAVCTLPSQSAMMAGLYPHEIGTLGADDAIPDAVTTLAEHLRGVGYRTGAVTDAGFLSRRYGFDQGFAWFDEGLRTIEETVEESRRFLDADDGRPTFLFVQTYRAHQPYRVSDATLANHGERLDIALSHAEVMEHYAPLLGQWDYRPPMPDEVRGVVEPFRSLYHGGVMDLDAGFGSFVEVLRERGIYDHGYLVFTSDHGEEIGEHDALGHKSGVFEELIKIPMVLHGPGVPAGRSEHGVSLVDLPVTFSHLADARPDEGWRGTPLLLVEEDRPTFTFQCDCANDDGPRYYALVDGDRKIVLTEGADASPTSLFDLTADPAERADLRGTAPWQEELFQRLAPQASDLMELRHAPGAATPLHTDDETLRRLGYVGD